MPTTVTRPTQSIDLFCFASKNSRNIEIGIHHQKWAVATLLNQQSMQGRITKARKYFRPGSAGLLYCNPTHSFTTPFIIQSEADPNSIDTNTWPEAWCLPFRIRTLGDLSRQLPEEIAREKWPFLQSSLARIGGRGGVSAALRFTALLSKLAAAAPQAN